MTEGKRAVGQQFRANCLGMGGWAGDRQWGRCKKKVERGSHCALSGDGGGGSGQDTDEAGPLPGLPSGWVGLSY